MTGEAAAAITVVNTGALWWWTHLQIATAFFFGFPHIGNASPTVALLYHCPVGSFGLSIPQMFLILTITGCALLIPSIWLYTKGAPGRKRCTALVTIFSCIAITFSSYMVAGKTHLVTTAEHYVNLYADAEDKHGQWVYEHYHSALTAYRESEENKP